MANAKISEWSATAGSNTEIDGVPLGEGVMNPSNVNNALREVMSQVAELYTGASGDRIPVSAGGTGSTSAAGARTNLGIANYEGGAQTIYIPAGALTSRTSNGAASGTTETTTNKIMVKSLDFDKDADEFAQFSVRMPKSWNEGTVTAQFVWSHAAATAYAVVWGIQGVALSNDDAIDTAFGTAVTVTDTGGTTGDLYISDATAAVTIGGTPAEGDWVVFQVYRDADAGGDTLDVDAKLIGVTLNYTTNAATDA